jgi:hypothetical protein
MVSTLLHLPVDVVHHRAPLGLGFFFGHGSVAPQRSHLTMGILVCQSHGSALSESNLISLSDLGFHLCPMILHNQRQFISLSPSGTR